MYQFLNSNPLIICRDSILRPRSYLCASKLVKQFSTGLYYLWSVVSISKQLQIIRFQKGTALSSIKLCMTNCKHWKQTATATRQYDNYNIQHFWVNCSALVTATCEETSGWRDGEKRVVSSQVYIITEEISLFKKKDTKLSNQIKTNQVTSYL